MRRPLAGFLARRLAGGLAALLTASALIYASVNVLPGSVAEAVLGQNATPARVAAIEANLNLDRPLPERYASWLGGMVRGDFGYSTAALAQGNEERVSSVIGTPMANSLILAGITILLFVPLSMLLGVVAALRADRSTDRLISLSSLTIGAMPEFLIGTLLIVVFFTHFDLLPPISSIEPGDTPFTHPDRLILPVATLLAVSLSYGVRLVRASMVEVMRADYVAMARVNGLPEGRVILRYGLRNALGPTIQAVALTSQFLIGGIIVTESVFSFPGIGSRLVQAVSVHDFQLVAVVATLLAAVYILINVIADLLVTLVVPKLRTQT